MIKFAADAMFQATDKEIKPVNWGECQCRGLVILLSHGETGQECHGTGKVMMETP